MIPKVNARVLILAIFFAVGHGAMAQTTRYVWQGSSAPGVGFTSWSSAAHDIQSALNVAGVGDTILVTNGAYLLTAALVITQQVTLASVNGCGETIVNGMGTTRCFRVERAGVVVDGFTATNGYDAVAGGGVYLAVTGAVIRSSRVTGCRAQYGAGVFFGQAGGLMELCRVDGNTAQGADRQGGGVYLRSGVTVRSCLVTGNSAQQGGGAYLWQGGLLENCTVADNESGVFCVTGGAVTNSVLYFNAGGNWWDGSGLAAFGQCCTVPAKGVTCVTNDPLFVSRTMGNYLPAHGSPCIGAGTNQEWMGEATDLRGNPRVIAESVDLGAYESNPFIVATWEGHGNISPSGVVEVAYGNDFTITNIPDLNYRIADVRVDGFSVEAVDTLTISAVDADHTVHVVFDVQYWPMVYVAAGTQHSFPYTNWVTAATNLTAAMMAVSDGTQVLVSNGVHRVTAEVVLKHAVQVVGIGGTNPVIVDGGGVSRCFRIAHTNAMIAGLTVTNGYAATNGYAGSVGGGVYVEVAGGMISNSMVTGCRAEHGAGVYFAAGGGRLQGGGVAGNMILPGGGGGGGVYIRDGVVVSETVIRGNTASTGGGLYASQGGLAEYCELSDNNAFGDGGGAYLSRGGVVRSSRLLRNRAYWGGGGIECYRDGTVQSCLVAGNSATNEGGGIYLQGGGVAQGCTVTGNSGGYGGGICIFAGSVDNSIFYLPLPGFVWVAPICSGVNMVKT